MAQNSTLPAENHQPFQRILTQLTTNAQLATAKGLMVLPTQPLQVIMRNQQKAVHQQGPLKGLAATAAELYRHSGSQAFFRGVGPAGAKEAFKYGVYKAPLLKGAPDLVNDYFPAALYSLPTPLTNTIKPLAAGIIAGVADTVFGGAFERYATFRATAQGSDVNASFRSQLRGKTPYQVAKSLYRGSTPATLKSTVAFSTFFAAAAPAKQLSETLYGTEHANTWYGKLTAAVASGGAVALVSSPLDIAKTIAQMPNPSNEPTLSILKQNLQRHGVGGLCAGVGTKALLVALGWGVNKAYVDFSQTPRR